MGATSKSPRAKATAAKLPGHWKGMPVRRPCWVRTIAIPLVVATLALLGLTDQASDNPNIGASKIGVSLHPNVFSARPGPDNLPSPAAVPSTAALTPSSIVRSSNWAGYATAGGPYTLVTGTFTVPRLAAGTPFYDRVAEWVGVDGASSSDSSLIQAGVSEYSDPAGPSGFDVQPWSEILPAPVKNITSVTVQAGQRVTVTIWKLPGSKWEINLTDDDNGESYAMPPEQYGGPRSSAEWIVEATTTCSYGCLTALAAPYTPDVVFSGLGMTGREVSLEEDMIVRGKMAVSTPSALSADSFTVTYRGES